MRTSRDTRDEDCCGWLIWRSSRSSGRVEVGVMESRNIWEMLTVLARCLDTVVLR